MLVKHADGQVIDYSMIVQLPGFGDVEAVKSSVFKTDFSGNAPAELIMEFEDGKQIRTTDFVAENKFLDELTITDSKISKRLADVSAVLSKYGILMDEVLKVWLCHDDFSAYWTVGVDYKELSAENADYPEEGHFEETEDCVYIDTVKVYFMPATGL